MRSRDAETNRNWVSWSFLRRPVSTRRRSWTGRSVYWNQLLCFQNRCTIVFVLSVPRAFCLQVKYVVDTLWSPSKMCVYYLSTIIGFIIERINYFQIVHSMTWSDPTKYIKKAPKMNTSVTQRATAYRVQLQEASRGFTNKCYIEKA